MANKDVAPRRWGGLRFLESDRPFHFFRDEMDALHRSLDKVFGEVWNGGFKSSLLGDGWNGGVVVPHLDVTEDDEAFHVSVELPGMAETDIDVSVNDRLLTIRGEKKGEKEK